MVGGVHAWCAPHSTAPRALQAGRARRMLRRMTVVGAGSGPRTWTTGSAPSVMGPMRRVWPARRGARRIGAALSSTGSRPPSPAPTAVIGESARCGRREADRHGAGRYVAERAWSARGAPAISSRRRLPQGVGRRRRRRPHRPPPLPAPRAPPPDRPRSPAARRGVHGADLLVRATAAQPHRRPRRRAPRRFLIGGDRHRGPIPAGPAPGRQGDALDAGAPACSSAWVARPPQEE